MTENELSSIVIDEAILIHKALGPGLLETAYNECLYYKLMQKGLSVEKQKQIPLVFEGVKVDCAFCCDLLIEKKLIIEIKAVESLDDIHITQMLTYLKLTGLKLGFLINFNTLILKNGIRRVVNRLE